jgi:hypothetical protein
LAKLGIDCRVLDPPGIQVNRGAHWVKTDRIDVLALLPSPGSASHEKRQGPAYPPYRRRRAT